MELTITNPAPATRLPFRRSSTALGLFALAFAVSAVHAQYPPYTPPPPPLKIGPCVPTKEYPCTPLTPSDPPAAAPAQKFPFPGDAQPTDKFSPPASKTPASQAFPFPEDVDKPAAAPPTPAARNFPFPDDAGRSTATPATSTPAAKSFPFPDTPDPPAESSSSSSSSSNSSSSGSAADPDSSQPALADKGSSGSTRMQRRAQRRLLPKVEDLDAREAEDLQVSHYYASTGNFLASYLRAQDAVKTVPDDPLAHFALAESARKLNKKDEAVAEYKLYLNLDPEGERAKAAQRALAELGPK